MPKLRPLEAFCDNMADAHRLVLLCEAAANVRKRRMRLELREKVGETLGIAKRRWSELDCVESADLFIVTLPGSRMSRDDLKDRSPLLRQAIVAGCAATETYLADKVVERARLLVRRGETQSLGKIDMTLKAWVEVEAYTYRRRGITEKVIQPWVIREASTDPYKVGTLLSMVGVDAPFRELDKARSVPKGTTHAALTAVTARRNAIAHSGDRKGHGRARIDSPEVRSVLAVLESVVDAIESILGPSPT